MSNVISFYADIRTLYMDILNEQRKVNEKDLLDKVKRLTNM